MLHKHETHKAWQFQVEIRDRAGGVIDLTGFAITAQLRRALDRKLFCTLSLGEGLHYQYPYIQFDFTAEQLSVPAGEYQIGFEFTSPGGQESDAIISQIELTNRFIKS